MPSVSFFTGAHMLDGVWLLPRTWAPPEVTLFPYTVYAGVPATPIRKLNARSYQLLHMKFLRRQRECLRRIVFRFWRSVPDGQNRMPRAAAKRAVVYEHCTVGNREIFAEVHVCGYG
ncbi:hypothetical protein JKF63_02861 [Porcisia hertigi]|uniref:Uncharacterized protein n=1 Tax=Porcisia hertigi TaxID=2761500 RepID=A0A836L866_9TRYP|nr:hypothetical protein JKF63_02861 [Porcisia hertigi]